MPTKKLNGKMKAFGDAYLKDFNATQAAITVGYKNNKYTHTQAYKRLQSATLQKYLAEQTKKHTEKAEISIEWIIKELKQLYNRCQTTLSAPGAIAGATKQLELLGKYLGMFIERSEMTINIKEIKVIVIQIQGIISKHITDANIRNRIAEDLKLLGL